ncbi:amino acid adenylation domain-containing protein [Streptomyces olivaceus]|uniref:amino acid adenylation domain-containing protein n=1 Tax=Streptomyces olivaceus TaxID=47716 RepID=UPI001CC92CA0|nr:amino acid adenylation domain-containing protein [Streptomyces olivaceus]MBZ6085411.1 amino acid adenylation domain-containing protein [Streptomyces olivaceus]
MRTLTDYLDDAASGRPDAPAVEFQDETLTYAELHARSTALAETLLRRGIGAGDRVGLWLRKSPESIVGLYGILRTGAAYVPIDPGAPLDRAAKIIDDCRLAGVIAQAEHVSWLLEQAPADAPDRPVVAVGGTQGAQADPRVVAWSDAVSGAPAAPPAGLGAAPSAPAYVLYTSGSKGDPKGVVLSHANAVAFVEWAAAEFRITAHDRVSSHAPLHFDLSVLDVFATCLAGACVVLLPESQLGLGGVLNQVVVKRKVTVWYSVPNALNRMLTARNGALLGASALRVVLFAGEVFPVSALRRLRELLPHAELYNLYGPTETNVCTFHRVRDSDVVPGRTEPVPIGRPCAHATTFVVDESGEPLREDPGVTGELCVAGPSVMLGYWRDAPLTAGKRLTCVQEDGTSLEAYRTGDTVRVEAGGTYTFLGRNDDMVKIRGHRVELGEVESALCEAVREVVCVTVGDASGERHIEAYVVPFSTECDVSQLRQHCLDVLPRYMVPEHFHLVTALPRTRSGKLDRRAVLGL